MKLFTHDIGCAAGLVQAHAARLIIEGHDSAGAGSAAVDDEVEGRDSHIGDDEFHEDDELNDDQPRGRRTKQAQAYDDLKSEKDRLKQENERQARELASMNDRIAAIEGTRDTREAVNSRTNADMDRAKSRAREVVGEIQKLDRTDPEYSLKVYEAMFTKLYADQAETAETVSRRTSSEVYEGTRTREQQFADAKQQTLERLEEEGLEADAFELVQALSIAKTQTDPDWFKRVKPEDQIGALVNIVKERIIKTTRNSQEFKDEKKRHRESMDGVIESGSRSRRGNPRGEEGDDRQEGPGSILADLARSKDAKRRSTNQMLRQTER